MGAEGVGRSKIIRRRESLVLYKSFNTLCSYPNTFLVNIAKSPYMTYRENNAGEERKVDIYRQVIVADEEGR
jgi:hypothetical protein